MADRMQLSKRYAYSKKAPRMISESRNENTLRVSPNLSKAIDIFSNCRISKDSSTAKMLIVLKLCISQ